MAATIDAGRSAPVKRVAWSVCLVIWFVGNVLLWADRTNFSVAFAAWSKEYHFSPSVIGAMLSAFSFGYLFMQPVGGWIADRFGPRKTIGASIFLWSFWELLTPLAPAMLAVTGAFRALLGMSEAAYVPGMVVAISKSIPEDHRRGRFMTFLQSGSQLGPAVGVFFAASILGATRNPAMIFIAFGLFGIALAAIWWLYAMNRSDPVVEGERAETDHARARAAEPVYSFRTLITSRRLWPLYLSYAALPYCQYIFLTWLPQYLSHYRHLSIVQAGFVSSLPFLVAWVAAISVGWLMDGLTAAGFVRYSLNRKLFIYIGAAMYAVCTLIAATTASTTLAVEMIIVANAGLAFYVYPFWVMVTDIAPNQAGLLGGVMNCCGIVGATISPFVSGVIAERTGEFVAPLQVAAGLLVAAALVAAFFLKPKPISQLVG